MSRTCSEKTCTYDPNHSSHSVWSSTKVENKLHMFYCATACKETWATCLQSQLKLFSRFSMVVIVAKEKSMACLNLLVMGTNGVKIIHIMVSLPWRFLIIRHDYCFRMLQGKQANDTRRMSSSNRTYISSRTFYNRTYFYNHSKANRRRKKMNKT